MSRTLVTLSLTASLLGGTALAEAPRVAVDIAPVHSLVARVMQGVGTPDLVVQPGASPHKYSLRPSEAAALQEADVVFWIGDRLSPWLTGAIGNLAEDAAVTALMDADGTIMLDSRQGAMFEKHSHGDHDDHAGHDHGDDDHDHAAHDDHADHDHGEEKHADAAHDHDDHAGHDHGDEEHAAHDDHGHDHGAHDPHVWLSPENAAQWLNVIAGQLSAADPDNAGVYFANAQAGRAELETVASEVNAMLEPVREGRFIVFHDAYQYFENSFGLQAAGAISLSDASDPSPARIAEIQSRIAEQSVDCVLAEPQFNPGIVATVLDGTDARTGVIDPLGSDLAPGPDLYPQLIKNLASALADCMGKTDL